MTLFWMPLETVRALGWTLIHFLWQGVLLAALLRIILPACRSAASRHNCALLTLALMALAPIATFFSIQAITAAAPRAANAGSLSFAPGMPVLVLLWLAGVAALSLRALAGWHIAQSLKHRGTLAVPTDLFRRCESLRRRLAVTAPVHFLLSHRTDVPLVIGWLRPVILIPVSALAGLATLKLR